MILLKPVIIRPARSLRKGSSVQLKYFFKKARYCFLSPTAKVPIVSHWVWSRYWFQPQTLHGLKATPWRVMGWIQWSSLLAEGLGEKSELASSPCSTMTCGHKTSWSPGTTPRLVIKDQKIRLLQASFPWRTRCPRRKEGSKQGSGVQVNIQVTVYS